MITIQKMRELVDDSEELSDEKLMEARDTIYALLEIACNEYMENELNK